MIQGTIFDADGTPLDSMTADVYMTDFLDSEKFWRLEQKAE